MTKEEHRLIITMFGIHLGMMGELINVLRANGSLKSGDLKDIWNLAFSEAGKKEIFSAVSGMYERAAATCGVDIGLQP
jgi:hypothetical protein